MKSKTILCVVLVGGIIHFPALADDVTLASVPPVVVKTVPVAGADDVDPKRTEVRVTFSKDMQDKSWSWSTSRRRVSRR
ncbi:MAG TPA: Ig-like domain-containing protein [Fimbriiglobus sp.]|jgi:hypothetical protein